MSFDLKISNGDLVIGSNGDFEIVENADKLIQDILKILMCPLGSNVFFPWYGSSLSGTSVGQIFDEQLKQDIIAQQINSNLETLQKLQQQQMSDGQRVTPNELLAAIQSVSVERNTVDPTFFSIDVNVITKGFQVLTASLSVGL